MQRVRRNDRPSSSLGLALLTCAILCFGVPSNAGAQQPAPSGAADQSGDDSPDAGAVRQGGGPAGSSQAGSPWTRPEAQPSLFDPTPIGSLGAPSSSIEPRSGTAPKSRPVARGGLPASRAGQGVRREPPGRKGPARTGLAAWYEHPGRTASGEMYRPDGLTAAHRTLPFGTRVRVVNPRNGRSVIVRINDRAAGPQRIAVDLSRGAARRLGITGVESVGMSVVSGPARPQTPVRQALR